jgi:DNA (cytosine-5)-methyltransferase 1
MDFDRPYNFYEFFAGAGLARLGLGDSWRCLWANDIDPKKGEVYIANFGEKEFEIADIAKIHAVDLPLSPALLAWASFPCQDISFAGARSGLNGRRSGTFWEFWRIMTELKTVGRMPPIMVAENVAGLLSGDAAQGLALAFASLGMQFGALLIDAKYFSPQSRPRVFVVAVDSRIECSDLCDAPLSAVSEPLSPWRTKAAIDTQKALPLISSQLWRWWKLPIPSAAPKHFDEIADDPPDSALWHSPAETKRIIEIMDEKNHAKLAWALAGIEKKYGLVYRRTRNGQQRAEARFDGVAGCLRTPKGGSSRQIVIVVEHGSIRSRLLTPREAARLMGAPDSFYLPNRSTLAYEAMGDAVSVPVVSWLSAHLLEPIARKIPSSPLPPYSPEMLRVQTEAKSLADTLSSERILI